MPKDEIAPITNETGLSIITETGVAKGKELAAAVAGMTGAQKIALAAKITEYVGAATDKIDSFLGQKLVATGVIMQRAQVRLETPTINAVTGEAEEFADVDRVVLRVKDEKGNTHYIGFVSIAIAGIVRDLLMPMFGVGDWADEVPIKITQVAARKGRTYQLQVLA